MLTVACVQVGNYQGCGALYVNTLRDMVARNLSLPHKFVCFTDNPEGLDADIETREISVKLNGWWNKLYLFKRGVLDGRVLFLDLDTCITGSIDDIASYNGRFALLRELYEGNGYGSGVMVWNDDLSHIWESFEQAGYPDMDGGDQAWIFHVDKCAEYLQDRFPGKFVSYKIDAQEWPSADSSVVCFHGFPKPHHFPSEWVKHIWKVGGLSGVQFKNGLNNKHEIILDQIRLNVLRDLPWFEEGKESGHACIVGGAPSLKDSFMNLRFLKASGAKIFALNGVHDWLIERGITPDYHVVLDSREQNVEFVRHPKKGVKYLVYGGCHSKVFDALEGHDVTLWLTEFEGVHDIVRFFKKPVVLVGGGNTVAMKTMYLGYLAGFRKFSMFGVDSSYRGGENHAYRQSMNDGEERMSVTVAGRSFVCAPWMAKQAMDFQGQARTLVKRGCEVNVYGDGLIPWVAQQLSTT